MENIEYKIITAIEEDGNRVYLHFNEQSTGYPCWILSDPHKFTIEKYLEIEVNNIIADFEKKSGYYYNSNIVVDSLEIQTIGVLDTTPIKIKQNSYEIDKKKAREFVASLGLSTQELELVLKYAKDN